jgi:hypothetical protein
VLNNGIEEKQINQENNWKKKQLKKWGSKLRKKLTKSNNQGQDKKYN